MTTLNQSSSGSTAVKAPEKLLVTEREAKWVEIQPFLLSAGYKLRARYDPNWVPSWRIGSLSQPAVAHLEQNCDVLDAIRIEDGKKVVMKWLAADSSEVQCIQYLSNISDPRNRTIPVLQILPLPNDIDVLVVMPYGRRFNHPAFHCRGEFAEAMRQFLEGLSFMHEHNICHFDIAPKNLMMDESRVVPRGSHFCYPKTHDGYRGSFAWENRCSVGPVDYYYIDFGLSMYYPKGRDTALTTGTLRNFRTIPELSETVPYNPFKVDVFQLGLTMANVIKDYPDLHIFSPVANRMMSTNPSDRPEPAQSLQEFNSIVARFSPKKLGSPILRKTGSVTYFARKVAGVFHWKNYPPTKRYEGLIGTTDEEIFTRRLLCGLYLLI
ncbi:kinase-like domain-containing protein [Mycena galopus ATCC 62051]|nr:kinase-like domain-containing protein [Mycena galopus ATCC 62051]